MIRSVNVSVRPNETKKCPSASAQGTNTSSCFLVGQLIESKDNTGLEMKPNKIIFQGHHAQCIEIILLGRIRFIFTNPRT